ncbi:glycosyltransferase [Pedobacter mucosus]|uniref:glycosyltransferase n=1 Tax=Pedobacter mucosus TaxID=2895286 RepID=UPI001EE45FEE|nr:glycosyltransferase [Pedobacter mucosus]UKT64782.1 glycosyltransferase [Pedobacter mucosus]
MRIGIIAHLKHPISAPFKGGLESFTYTITQKLVAMGHEVILFASSKSSADLPLHSILSDEDYDQNTGVRIKRKDLPSEYIAEHHAYFSLMMKVDDFNLDIIFNNSLHYIPITMANIVKTPILTVLHTPPFYELKMAIAKERQNPMIKYVTVSNQSAKTWENFIANCSVIPNGIEVNRWEFYPKANTPRYAIWFGRIHPDKGLHLAIAAAKIAKIPLKIAGAIADVNYYKTFIEPILDDNTELLGLCSHEQLNSIIGNASVCLVTPTWEEPFGLVIAEAMACGTPIAGFKIGALPELVVEGTGILVEPANFEALGIAINLAINLDRKYVRDYALQHFDLNKMMLNYEQMLSEVCENYSLI